MPSEMYYGRLVSKIIDEIINYAKVVLHTDEYEKEYRDLLQNKELLFPAVAHIIDSRLRGTRSVYPRILSVYYNGYGYRLIIRFFTRLGLIRPVAQRTQTRGQIMRYKVTDTLDKMLQRHGIYPVWMDKH